jgi:hypothetical protein
MQRFPRDAFTQCFGITEMRASLNDSLTTLSKMFFAFPIVTPGKICQVEFLFEVKIHIHWATNNLST